MSSASSYGRLVWETSSVMPTVKRRLGALAGELVEHGGDHPRRELLRRQPVAAADHPRHQLALALRVRLAERREHVEEQRLAERSGLLGPVEHGDAAHGGRQRLDQLARRERPVEPDLCHADALAARLQVAHRLARGLGAGAHQHEHALGLRVAAVVDEPVAAAGPLPELVHHLLHDAGHAGVEGVDGLARLEVDVRVLGGAADERPLGRQGALAVRADQLVGDQRPQVVVGEQLERVQLVRGAEPVEEVHERHPRPERRRLRDQRQVVRLLHRRRRQQREAGLAHGHHVGVVAEDRQPLRRQRPRGHVQHRRGELAGDLVHVRDHQQQALGGGERRRERSALQRAVQRARPRPPRSASRPPRGRCPRGWAAPGSTTRRRARPSATTA